MKRDFCFVKLQSLGNVDRIYWSCGTRLPRWSVCCAEARRSAFVGIMTFCLRVRLFCSKERERSLWRSSAFHDSYMHWSGQQNFVEKQVTSPLAPFCSCQYCFSIVFPNMKNHSLPHQGLNRVHSEIVGGNAPGMLMGAGAGEAISL